MAGAVMLNSVFPEQRPLASPRLELDGDQVSRTRNLIQTNAADTRHFRVNSSVVMAEEAHRGAHALARDRDPQLD
jgi:hypothetical protein